MTKGIRGDTQMTSWPIGNQANRCCSAVQCNLPSPSAGITACRSNSIFRMCFSLTKIGNRHTTYVVSQ